MRDTAATQTYRQLLDSAVACALNAIGTGQTTRLDLREACLYAQPDGAGLTLVVARAKPASTDFVEPPGRERLLAHLADAHPSNGVDIPVVAALSDDGSQLLYVIRLSPPLSGSGIVPSISTEAVAQALGPGFDATLRDALRALLDLVRGSAR